MLSIIKQTDLLITQEKERLRGMKRSPSKLKKTETAEQN